MRCSIQYVTRLLWVSNTLPLMDLPPSITALYCNSGSLPTPDPSSSSAKTLSPSRPSVSSTKLTTVSRPSLETNQSPRAVTACALLLHLAHGRLCATFCVPTRTHWTSRGYARPQNILQPRQHVSPGGREPAQNSDFTIMFKQNFHLELWSGVDRIKCICGRLIDAFGDHCLSCPRMCKTPISCLCFRRSSSFVP